MRAASFPSHHWGATTMAKLIKIKCNGAGQHVNDVDLDRALEEAVVYRGAEARLQNLPERGVTLRCRVCAEGRIVITRPMLEEMLGADHA
jgi:hypothetical protein